MCGILGANQENRDALKRAAASFAYRGPDAFGLSVHDGIGLAHNRLSILDLDTRASQPMQDESGEYEIVFNGEIYNFQELKTKLAQRYSFRTTSDTEVLLYAYREYGVKLTRHIRGMYAFAIYDKPRKKMVLFRDQAGIKPLYYYVEDGFCVFASELKGITSFLRQLGKMVVLDQEAFSRYWLFGFIPSPDTLVRDVKKLMRGCVLEYDLTSRTAEVFTAERETLVVSREDELKSLMEERILEHLVADVPVGVFFSGGTDSSLIASILHRHKIDLQTFSLRLAEKKEDERSFTEINRLLKLRNQVIPFGVAELEKVYPTVMSRIDEPIADTSLLATTYLSQCAGQEVKVVLSGEGGDELFYGYHRQVALGRMRHIERGRTKGWLLDSLRPWLALTSFGSKVVAKSYAATQDAAGFYLSQMALLRGRTPAKLWRVGRDMIRGLACPPILLDREIYLENDLLRKIDMATSYASIEGRVPFLDPDVIASAEQVVSREIRSDHLKPFLKGFLADYLPKEVVYRPKSGFGLRADLLKQSKSYQKDLGRAVKMFEKMDFLDRDAFALLVAGKRESSTGFSLISMAQALQNLGLIEGV